MVQQTDNYPALNTAEANTFWQVVGNFFYYDCAADPSMLVTLNNRADYQEKSNIWFNFSTMQPPIQSQSPATIPVALF